MEISLALTVNTNSAALTALRYQGVNQRNTASSFARISSGLRIGKAADDAAGLAVSENLDATERSARQARRNINDGISVIQTAEGTSREVLSSFKRMRELATQSASETLNSTERSYAQTEFSALSSEIWRLKKTSEFNGIDLLKNQSFNTQVGVDNTSNDRIALTFIDPTYTPTKRGSMSSIAQSGPAGDGWGFSSSNNLQTNTNAMSLSVQGQTIDLFDLAATIEANGGSSGVGGVLNGTNFTGTTSFTFGSGVGEGQGQLDILLNDIFELSGTYGGGTDLTTLQSMPAGPGLAITDTMGRTISLTVTADTIGDKTGFGLGTTSGSTSSDAIDPIGAWDISTVAGARTVLDQVDTMIDHVNLGMTQYGAAQNRLTSALNNIEVYTENVASAKSQIRDADFAHETAELAKNQIMSQASTSVLSQANQINQGALRLLG